MVRQKENPCLLIPSRCKVGMVSEDRVDPGAALCNLALMVGAQRRVEGPLRQHFE